LGEKHKRPGFLSDLPKYSNIVGAKPSFCSERQGDVQKPQLSKGRGLLRGSLDGIRTKRRQGEGPREVVLQGEKPIHTLTSRPPLATVKATKENINPETSKLLINNYEG